MNEFEDHIKTTKRILFDEKQIVIEKDYFKISL